MDSLLKQCRENNPNLSAAFYRVEQARENARMEKSQLYPWLSGNGSFETVNPSKNVAQSSGSYEKWTTGFGLTWDLDLFGRIRSILEADIADAQAELDAYNNLILSMQTSVANSYFTIRQYRSEIELLDRTLNVRTEQTDLVRRRVELDFASELTCSVPYSRSAMRPRSWPPFSAAWPSRKQYRNFSWNNSVKVEHKNRAIGRGFTKASRGCSLAAA
ncbi:MAG: TolC family protein [Bacilli bacterium]